MVIKIWPSIIIRPVQSRRSEAAPPKLPKWPIVGAPKLMSYVFGGACVEGGLISAIPCCSTSYKRHCLLFYVILLHSTHSWVLIMLLSMWRTMMSAWVWGCPPERWMVGRRSLDYNVVFVLLLAARRRLARSARLRLLFRDGCAPSATTTLKVMLTASTQ